MQANLEKLIPFFPFEISEKTAQLFEEYVQALLSYNQHTNLTAHRDAAMIFEKGILDSLLFPILPNFIQGSWLDVGSGAGFPGIPLLLQFPHSQWTLLEPIGKKATFLKKICQDFHLSFEVVVDRAESFILTSREHYDGVVSRAVASLPILLELCLPFLKVGGYFLAYKGEKVEEEVSLSSHALQCLGGNVESIEYQQLPTDQAKRSLIIIRKIHSTPQQYPRMFSQIKHSPL